MATSLANIQPLLARGATFPLVNIAFSATSIFQGGWDPSKQTLQEWREYQIAHENEPMTPGPALRFLKQLMGLNQLSPDPIKHPLVHAHVVSQQDPFAALRFLNSLRQYSLETSFDNHSIRCSYLSGGSPLEVLVPLGAHIYLSGNEKPVAEVLKAGIGAARLSPMSVPVEATVADEKIRIAFDGDSCIFGDAMDRVYKTEGLAKAQQLEMEYEDTPIEPGPLHGFLMAVAALRSVFPDQADESPLNLIFATARGYKAQRRAIKTLRHWGVLFDRAHFLSGGAKGPVLRQSKATILFDDGAHNIKSAHDHGVPAGHVPWGGGQAI